MKYRSKFETVTALLWTEDCKESDFPTEFQKELDEGRMWFQSNFEGGITLVISTPLYYAEAEFGDYIVYKDAGLVSVLGETEFEKEYERVESDG